MTTPRSRIPLVAACGLLAAGPTGCGLTSEYRDTNAAVDANPMCASRPDQPNAPVALECRRETSTVIHGSRHRAEAPDFRGKSDDEPR